MRSLKKGSQCFGENSNAPDGSKIDHVLLKAFLSSFLNFVDMSATFAYQDIT
jgi:hypothetical protein